MGRLCRNKSLFIYLIGVTGGANLRRRKPDNTAEMLIFILLLIPIAAYYLLKWIIKGITAICVWAYNKKCISSPASPINANINGLQSEYVSTNSISSEAQKCHESD